MSTESIQQPMMAYDLLMTYDLLNEAAYLTTACDTACNTDYTTAITYAPTDWSCMTSKDERDGNSIMSSVGGTSLCLSEGDGNSIILSFGGTSLCLSEGDVTITSTDGSIMTFTDDVAVYTGLKSFLTCTGFCGTQDTICDNSMGLLSTSDEEICTILTSEIARDVDADILAEIIGLADNLTLAAAKYDKAMKFIK